ncbi:MAG TPA: carboxypeptidase regulatory-like domain-containing protein [Longimicrobiaceae bacterium]|nr:carboxypeptidase regulatory-like domain-containing protein [Longimicrobiaceae bacterium]
MPSPTRLLSLVRGLMLLALGVGSALDAAAQQTPRTVQIPPIRPRYVPPAEAQPPVDTAGLRFRLSEGRRTGSAPAPGRPAGGTRLSAQEAERLLRRLPPLRAELSPADSFIFPPQSPPPPRTGTEVRAPFPPPDTAAPPALPAARVLEVVRRSPEGAVERGAGVTVVFSQPMVPLSSVGEVAAQAVPARITPRVPGRWRWIDVQTLVFEPEGRLPMATRYTVEVPAGTRSATAGALARAVSWSFSTPAPRALGAHPQGEPAARHPLLLLTWDQEVSAEALLPFVRVEAQGRMYPVRVATAQEVEADERVRDVVRGEEGGRWTAFRTTTPLPADAEVRVTLVPGAPSAEGLLRTEVAQEWTFRTYGPLRVTQHACGYSQTCRPGEGWRIEFSNPLDPEAWSDTLVRVEPSLPGMQLHVRGNTLVIQGQARPSTTYRVHLHPSLRDRFGQRLGSTPPLTFTVTVPLGRLWSIGEGFVVLDPVGPRRVPVYSHDVARLRVRVLRVRPEDWPRFVASLSRRRRDEERPALPGQEVVSRLVTPGAEPGRVYESLVDVSPALEGGLGHAIVAVEPEHPTGETRRNAVYLWVQSTRIGLAALADNTRLLGWATSLADGAPLRGVSLALLDAPESEVTDADGLASLPLPATGSPDEGRLLVARLGRDAALLPERAGRGGWGGWQRHLGRSSLAWYVVTDRNLYRPGEEVRFKGWVRRLEPGDEGGPVLPGSAAGPVRFTVHDSEGNEVGRGSARLSPLGGFDGAFTVPAGTHLGPARIHLELEGAAEPEGREWDHGFVIQEFRRPEFVVGVTADPGPHRVGGSAEVTANAAYYSGGGLPGAEVKWSVRATPTRFVPPGWDAWSFGEADGFAPWGRPYRTPVTRTFEGRTDASGNHALRIDFERADPPLPSSVQAEATVLDVNRQTWTASAQLLVHPAEVYVGLRTGRFWVEAGKSFEVEVVVLDLAGKPVAGREVEVRAGESVGEWAGGEWRADTTARSCRLVSAAAPLRCTFRAERGGRFRIAAVVRDEAGRPSWTETALWVSGGVVERPEPPLMGEEREVQLIPDRREYRPGETAEILLRLPFFPARGVLSVVRSGITRTESFDAGGPTHVVRVPIGERDTPNLGVRVDLVGRPGTAGGDSTGTRGTDFATGSVDLPVPPLSRTLQVSATPRDTLMEPDARTTVEVTVRDAAGRPVAGSEVMLAVVDEAVLALTGYRHPNPVATFYPQRPMNVRANKTRPHVLLAPQEFRPAPGTLVGRVTDARTAMPLGGATVALRGTALRAVTDAHGRFRIQEVAPGRYTVTAERAGYARVEQEVRVRAEAHPALHFALVPVAGAPGETVALEQIVVTGAATDFAVEATAGGAAERLQQAHPAMAPPPPPSPEAPVRRARDGGPPEAGQPQIALRTNFDALAHFAPAVRTDAAGRARVEIDLPSNLTRYRVVAVAVSGDRFYGLGESGITARRALMVRPSPPRFLNFGDRFELPVMVQNRSGRPLEVNVAIRGTGIELAEAGWQVTVPADDRVEVRFPALATRAGTARFQVAVEGGAYTDAAEQALPVWTPATAEAFATYGAVDSGTVVLPLRVPGAVLPGFGGLEVTTSSTALQELTDALLYLVRYPFECSEQIASRVVSVAALRDVLTAFRAEGMPPPEALRAAMERDIALLAELQNEDGGWPFWKRGDPSWPFVSVHVAHALQRAREKGFAVPEGVMQRARAYLANVEERTPGTYPARVRNAVASYAVYVRGRMRDPGAAGEAAALLRRTASDSLTLEARGWLLTTLATGGGSRAAVDSLVRQVTNRATETAATATFATSYGEGEYLILHSSRRTDAVLLEALIAAAPRSDLIPKTVRGLLGHRRRGRWESTQENAWVLLALDRYFNVYERQTPEFVARAWLGERYVGGHSFQGRTTERHHVSVPMRVLAAGDSATRLVLDKEGPGRMYYRAGMRYAPASLELRAAQQGFAVARAYEAVDDSADVRHDPDGSWRVRAGARVRVRVTMTAPARRHHVALADPLPAGFEPLNPELAGTQGGADEPEPRGRLRGPGWGWLWRWWEHQNLRDDRAEAFTSLLPAGTYTYTYLARATTPGTFVVPPARAEEMYHPETFGRTATERVRVEER